MPLQTPLSFRWPAEFVARIDAARGDVPRSAFVRRAVERVLPAPPVPRAEAEAAQVSREELVRRRDEKMRAVLDRRMGR